MDYFSTRGGAERVSSAAAILKGLASDGGLFVPASFPQMPLSAIEELADLSYEERAVRILRLFFDRLYGEGNRGLRAPCLWADV